MSFDAVAPSFDRCRALPDGVAESIRWRILASPTASPRPLILDLGAGTGRVGRVFVAAGDAYVGVDLSFSMLRQFGDRRAILVQADGERLPFQHGTFDVVMLMQVLSGAPSWQGILDETRRVLRPKGIIAVGRVVTPRGGVDDQMKTQLASVLHDMRVTRNHGRQNREQALCALRSTAKRSERMITSSWTAQRSAHTFLARHGTGAGFSALPPKVRSAALAKLATWAETTFGLLDAAFPEEHVFELHLFRF